MKKILIVDDEKEIVTLLQLRLKAAGYETIVARDGMEGLAKARTENPDLIILDLMLPKMDGYNVCRMIKFDDNYHHIPVIIFSARAQDKDKKMAKETGADAYIAKPFKSEELLSCIKKLLGE